MSYRIGVFATTKGLIGRRWFNEVPGCCVHLVEAQTGAEAQRKAIEEHRTELLEAADRELERLKEKYGLPEKQGDLE